MGDIDIHYREVGKISEECRKRNLHSSRVDSFLEGLPLRDFFRTGEYVLDVGCGQGGLIVDLARKYDIHPVGLDLKDLDFGVKKEFDFYLGKAEDLPFQENTFGGGVSFLAFHYVPDRLKALSEFHRVLKIGARAIIDFDNLVPNDSGSKLVSEYTSPTLEAICKTFDKHRQVEVQRVNLLDEGGKQTRRSQRVILTKKTDELRFPPLKDFRTKPGPFPFAYSYY